VNQVYTASFVALIMASASTAAMAQSVAANEAAASGGSTRLEEVVVTATRRSENLQKVPVAVTAITAAALKNQGVFNTSDLNHAIPNFQVSSPYGTQQPNFTVRGIGVGTEFNSNAASPVGVYVDEVYQSFRASHGQQLYDLSQIEVVKGPQGTLYGRNTTGGAINFTTNQPSLNGDHGYLTLGYGDYNTFHGEGAAEFTTDDGRLGIRIAGTYTSQDPYIQNLLPAGVNLSSPAYTPATAFGNPNTGISPGGGKSYGFRATIRFKPNENLDISLKGYGAASYGGAASPLATGQSTTTDTISLATSLLGGLYTADGGALVPLLPPPYSRSANGLNDLQVQDNSLSHAITRSAGVVLHVKYRINDKLDLISVTGFDNGTYYQSPTTDCDGTPYDVCSIGYESHFRAFNQDVRFDYHADRFKLIVGGYFGWDRIVTHNTPDFFNFLSDLRQAVGLPANYFDPGGALTSYCLPGVQNSCSLPTGIRATQDYTQSRKSEAVYAEANYDITNSITLTGGLRYTRDQIAYYNALTTYYDDTGAPRLVTVSNYAPGGVQQAYLIGVSPGTYAPLSESSGSGELTGRAILDWKVTDKILTYASYSHGYRAGTYNGLAYQAAQQVYFVKPETVDAFEVGLKSRFLDDRVQFNGAAFYYDYHNQQGQLVGASAVANLISLDGKEKGLEGELQFAATRTLHLTASAGYLDSSYDKGSCPAAITGFIPQDGNCLNTAAGVVNVGGNPFPYAAKFSANLGFDWDLWQYNDNKLTLHGDANYTGRFYYDSLGAYNYTNPITGVSDRTIASGVFHEGGGDDWVLNSRLSYVTGRYTISAWIKNLTNTVYYPFGINLETIFGVDYRIRADPRTYGIEATARF
jgi:iron complex outermembrane receptor protein